ncbi:MAG TPA: adenine phosphoribosyltransferase [Polyangiales bacterium]|nr:adenine phosphoribosyltransferase [Polyangiales bacterium]
MTDPRIDLIQSRIRDVPDFPKPGIIFKDITPVLADGAAFGACIDLMAEKQDKNSFDVIVAMEARGFIFGAALAAKLGKGFVPVRKPGKLPWQTHQMEYELEYGTDKVEMHKDGVLPKQRVLIVDDLIATGGTAWAACELVKALRGTVVGACFLIELSFLPGRERIESVPVSSVIVY